MTRRELRALACLALLFLVGFLGGITLTAWQARGLGAHVASGLADLEHQLAELALKLEHLDACTGEDAPDYGSPIAGARL